jgi:hypothetical protein
LVGLLGWVMNTTQHNTPMERSPWEVDSHSASREIQRFLWNPKVINMYTRARQWSISWAKLFQMHSNIILSSTAVNAYCCHKSTFGLLGRSVHVTWLNYTRVVWKVRGLALLLRVGTLLRCGDGLFFEIPPLASDTLLTTLHPLLENVLQTVCRKLQEDSGTGGFDLGAPFSWLEKPINRMERDLNCKADVLMGFHRSRWAHPLPLFSCATLTLH